MLAMTKELATAIGISAVVSLAVVSLVLAFLIVLAVRSVPNKLLLLGFLLSITTILLAVFVPETGRLALALLIPAIILIFVGAICLAIAFAVKMFKSDNKEQTKT
jgi:NADH:ubiquinone oxidoreductase subunit 6 (subunit J)